MEKQKGQDPQSGAANASDPEPGFADSAFGLLEEQRQSLVSCYRKAKENVVFPGGEEAFRCNLPIFDSDAQADIRDCVSFFFWRDSQALYLFPNLDSLEEWFFHSSFTDFSIDAAERELHLTTIPLENMAYFAACESWEMAESGSYLHPVRESTGELVAPGCTEVIMQYRQNGQDERLRIEPSSFSVFERWFPEKEYHEVRLQQQDRAIPAKEVSKEKPISAAALQEAAVDVEAQLEELKRLFQKGLISEADYEIKKSEILKQYFLKK